MQTKTKFHRLTTVKSKVERKAKLDKNEEAVRFPIAGIGTSAGGLDALEHFLKKVPQSSPLAFVIIQHLDPSRKGILPELLQKFTHMKVIQVRDRLKIRSRCVYVIPPNKDMSLLRGRLHLIAPVLPRGQRLPIDFFFHSLAHDRREHAIGIVLSGMGSDGMLGLQAIKEKGGLTLVQDPTTAKFDGMPKSAVNAGVADIVAQIDDLPGRLINYLERSFPSRSLRPSKQEADNAVDKIVILLRIHTGHDFALYKKNTLYRRIQRRLGIHQLHTIADYFGYLQKNPKELDLLFKELLIGITSFFRDRAVWEELQNKILPALIASRSSGHVFRAWLPGCSTGEEAYSLAISFKQAIDEHLPHTRVQLKIFATDLDKDAIIKARLGVYSESSCGEIPPKQLSKFFDKHEHGYRVISDIREMVVFAPHSLIKDPPFTRLDFVSCRNLLIYFMPEMQNKLMPLFHYSLSPGGVLLLGGSETIGAFKDYFKPIDQRQRIFQRIGGSLRIEPLDFPASFTQTLADEISISNTQPKISLQAVADQFILEKFAPPAVLVDVSGNIVYVSGRTGRYLEPAAGKANWNIFAMAREGLRYELGNLFQKALKKKIPFLSRRFEFEGDTGTEQLEVSLQRLTQPEAMRGFILMVFTPVPSKLHKTHAHSKGSIAPASHKRLVKDLELKYQRARQETQIVREEMQSSQEELRSTNEEQQSTNEELQSTNEELTTSKEEMQSLNEELQTVNAELQAKVEELSRSNNDMKNLLNSTDIATLFLDEQVKIRRFTTQATKIFKLIPSDIGRPITDFSSDLLYPEFRADIQEVLNKLTLKERSVETSDDRWFAVRVMPYRTLDNRIDGIVITFSDITAAKKLEARLREQQPSLEKKMPHSSSKKISVARPESLRSKGRAQNRIGDKTIR